MNILKTPLHSKAIDRLKIKFDGGDLSSMATPSR